MGLFGSSKKREDKKKNKTLQKAQKFARKGQIDKAIAEWESLLKKKSDDANVYNTIGDLYLKGRKREQALDAYSQARQIYSDSGFSLKAIAVNKKILKLDPNNVDALTRMARLNQERGMVNNAKECYLALAEYHIRTGGQDLALEAYQHIVDMDPRNLKVKLGLAELYLKENMVQEGSNIYGEVIGSLLEQDKHEDAEKLCKKLESMLSSPDAALRFMVQIHLAQGRVDEAHDCFAKLEEDVREDPELQLIKAEVLIRRDEVDEGLGMIESIDRSGLTEFSRLKIFRILLKRKMLDQAFDVLDDLETRYSETGRLEELLGLYRQVMLEDASHLKTRHRLVDILKKMKRHEEVIQQYKEIGRLYAAAGEVEKAQNIYDKVLDITPGDIEVQAHLRELKGEPALTEAPDYGEVVLDGEADGGGAEGAEAVKVEAAGTETGGGVKTYEIDDDVAVEVLGSDGDDQQTPVPASAVGGEGERTENDPDGAVPGDSFLDDNATEADVYIKYGHMKKAMVHLEKNLERDPKHITTHERFLQIFVEQGNTQEQINTLLILVKLYREQGDLARSDELLNEVIALDPANGEAQKLLREGPDALGPNALDDVPETAENLNFEFDETDKTEPPSLEQQSQQIEVFDHDEQDEESISELLDEANFYVHHRMVDEARVIYEKILSLHPNRPDIVAKLERLSTGEGSSAEEGDGVAEIVSEGPEDLLAEEDVLSEVFETAEGEAFLADDSPETVAPSLASGEFVDFAEELRQEVDSSVSDLLEEKEGSGQASEDPLDFSSELRREVEQSIAPDRPAFGESDVMDIFNEFRQGVQRELEDEDHETHYNLGIAYLEMGLINEACEEFVVASKDNKRMMDCIGMIGLCHIQKGEFKKALSELEKGLALEGRTDEEYIGIRYEIAKVCELLGDKERSGAELLWIHGINSGYRDVAAKLKELGVAPTGQNGRSDPSKNKVSYL